jgi:predicted DNA binding CopG/RHH family protein
MSAKLIKPIKEKLNQANKVVEDIENDNYPEKEGKQLPKFVSLINMRGKQHLVFEKRSDDKRLNLKLTTEVDNLLRELASKTGLKLVTIISNGIKSEYKKFLERGF